MVRVSSFGTDDTLQYRLSLDIRREVFIREQNVPPGLECENEEEARYYLVYHRDIPVGTGRWRNTPDGIKLERFAVLPGFRNIGLGSVLLNQVMKDIIPMHKKIYLHSQVRAVEWYMRAGFRPEGRPFEEAGIIHYLMIWNPQERDR
ncbi:MAG: GNAT family N-acetyltransferase [Bacteroidales bacterium]|nr:GNAT family N-acetyltransferase [Bacteroidales bacterium]